MSEEVILEEHKDDQWPETTSGHPKGLMTLFFSEMWERFCYYGMRTILMLYLVKSLLKGDAEASLIYGAYTGLVYAAPILGGQMADKFLGYRYAVMFGAILMAIGEFIIIGGTDSMLLLGMGALIVGNGYFKANISTIVGKLYKDGDPKRDSGFTIFYIGINIGAFLATSVVAYVGETYGFRYGFGLAGLGMLAGLIIFWMGRDNYSKAEGLDVTDEGKKTLFGPINYANGVAIGSLLLIPLCYVLILNNEWLNGIFLILFVFIAFTLIKAGIAEDKRVNANIWKDRMIALLIFMVINIVFWACFEQAGTSLTLFADRIVNRDILGWTMPASMTQVFNPTFIIIFGSIFSMMWLKLSKMGKNPSIPLKFAFGIIQLGLGFLVTKLAANYVNESFQVPLFTLVILYLLHTTGELFLSPIGLSMVTKLSPKKMAGTAMGAWFLSFAMANLLGGQIATLTSESKELTAQQKEEQVILSTTLKDGLVKTNNTVPFKNWRPLGDHKDIPVNISYGKWLEIHNWVEFRESMRLNESFSSWKEDAITTSQLKDLNAWLNPSEWDDLRSKVGSILKADKNADKKEVIDFKAWNYYKGGFAEGNYTGSISEAFDAHQKAVNKSGLENYVSVFTMIGLVLIGFAFVVIMFNKPIKKLMHGVE